MSKSSSNADLASRSSRDLEKAAKNGHVDSMLELAPRLLNKGLSWDSPESFDVGVEYLVSAAGNGDIDAIVAVGDIYSNGWHDSFPAESMNSDSIFACGGCERERLEIAMDYYEQARELKYEWAAARIERTRERLKKLEQDDQDDSAAEPSK